jgi:acyl-CoA dehydrogenase
MTRTQSTFLQSPPILGNQFADDPLLRGYLERVLSREHLNAIKGPLTELGELAGNELYRLQLADREHEPRLTQWNAWGERIDRIELTRVWETVAPLAARFGLIALPYEAAGAVARIQQFALVYLFTPASDMYSCPLAMTDGAARTLSSSGNAELIQRAVPRLTSRDPARAWTSGQWMTESIGGSDVSQSLTTARLDEQGQWRLYGKKWFTSAITADMALTLARPDGHGPGASQLALFYVETRDAQGRLNGLQVERLKDKLGTRKLPTAELQLNGAIAIPVQGLKEGTRRIEPMLAITRTWNSVTAVSFMRRALALARSYAKQRRVFGAALIEQPLHIDTLATLEAQFRAAFVLTFEVVQLLGQSESSQLSADDQTLLRVLTPIVKLLTAKQCVALLSEVIECFGGAGYVEDTGIPVLLRDAQVLPIWEGTTNVLALDALLRSDFDRGLILIEQRIARSAAAARAPDLQPLSSVALGELQAIAQWFRQQTSREDLQAGARRAAMGLGRALQVALLIEHAQWQLDTYNDHSGVAAARRFVAARTSHEGFDFNDARRLV